MTEFTNAGFQMGERGWGASKGVGNIIYYYLFT